VLTITVGDLWGDAELRRHHGRQAAREARKRQHGEGTLYANATPEEHLETARHLRDIAALHYAVAKLTY
jgi:hypothetical protein